MTVEPNTEPVALEIAFRILPMNRVEFLQTGDIKTLMGAIGVLGELDRVQIFTSGRQMESSAEWA